MLRSVALDLAAVHDTQDHRPRRQHDDAAPVADGFIALRHTPIALNLKRGLLVWRHSALADVPRKSSGCSRVGPNY